MFYNSMLGSYKIDRKDLNSFKNYTLIFALTQLNAFFESTWTEVFGLTLGSLLNAIIGYGGIIILVYGIYMLTKRNPKLPSAKKILFWFTVLIIIAISRILFSFTFLNLTDASQSINLLTLYFTTTTFTTGKTILVIRYIQLFYLFLIGIIVLLISNYFTSWFNDVFGRYNPTNAYYFFGIFFFIGSIISILGTFVFSPTTSNSLYQLPNPAILIGALFAGLIALIFEITAGFKFYNRVNDMVIGKIPHYNFYTPPYQLPYQNPYQASYQNANQVPFQNSNQNVGNEQQTNVINKSFKFCSNCGIKLDRGDNFCKNCGYRF